jgi:hypothetical protein
MIIHGISLALSFLMTRNGKKCEHATADKIIVDSQTLNSFKNYPTISFSMLNLYNAPLGVPGREKTAKETIPVPNFHSVTLFLALFFRVSRFLIRRDRSDRFPCPSSSSLNPSGRRLPEQKKCTAKP